MSDLIRKSDALAAAKGFIGAETAIAALPAVTVGVTTEDIDALAYRFWSIHPKDIPEPVGMPEGYKGGRRAWFFATEIRRILAALEAVAAPDLSDPVTVHANMLRGTIAKPTVEQIIHLYGREAFQPMIDAAVAKALEEACLAVSEHADWPEDAHGRTEQVDLFARVINAIRAITPAENVAAPNLKRIGTGLYETQPTPDHAAIREAWEKAYWRMRSYAVHDNDCKLNKPPRFDGPCSCGLTAALEEALALISKGAAEPTEYERKVAQMKKDFPNGI